MHKCDKWVWQKDKINLTYSGLVTPHGGQIWVNIDSGDGLMTGGTKSLPEPVINPGKPEHYHG